MELSAATTLVFPNHQHQHHNAHPHTDDNNYIWAKQQQQQQDHNRYMRPDSTPGSPINHEASLPVTPSTPTSEDVASGPSDKGMYAPGASSTRSAAFLHKHRRGSSVLNGTQSLPVSPTEVSPTQSGVATPADYRRASTGDRPSDGPHDASGADDVSQNLTPPPERPLIIRKKSGELVKSSLKLPALARTQSMPTPKAVHFNDNIAQVRRFFHTERPSAVSSARGGRVKFSWGSSTSGSDSASDSNDDEDYSDAMAELASDDDDDDETETRSSFDRGHGFVRQKEVNMDTINFKVEGNDFNDEHRVVLLENVFLSADKTNLVGHVAVKNLSFQKNVAIRFTLDNWNAVTEVSAEYNADVRKKVKTAGYDRFTFVLKLADLPQHTVNGGSFEFCVRYRCEAGEFWDNNNGQNYALRFSRSSAAARAASQGRPRPRMHRRSKTEGNAFGGAGGNADTMLDHESLPFLLKRPDAAAFTSRYNFGASLKDSVKQKKKSEPAAAPASRAFVPPKPDAGPAQTMSYQDIIAKYCFFNTSPTKPVATEPQSEAAPVHGVSSGSPPSHHHHRHHHPPHSITTPAGFRTPLTQSPSIGPQGSKFSPQRTCSPSPTNSPPEQQPAPAQDTFWRQVSV